MREEIVRGRSLEEIRKEYSLAWGCPPEELSLEVLDKPGLFSRQWKIKVSLESGETHSSDELDQGDPTHKPQQECPVSWDEADGKYKIECVEAVKRIEPFPPAGAIYWNGQLQDQVFWINPGDQVEFYPAEKVGQFTWEIELRDQGIQTIALVNHEKSGCAVLGSGIPADVTLRLEKVIGWEELSLQGETWDEEKFKSDLQSLGIVYGVKPDAWTEILKVEGKAEVLIAEGTLSVPPEPARLEDYVGEVQPQNPEDGRIDFFASKVHFVQEGAILARKIPGVPGIPGIDVRGEKLPVEPVQDFEFKLKKNVKLSEDGLQVLASSAGIPIRVDEATYLIENIYLLNQDVDLATGSIEFPGDVMIAGNVHDGIHIFSGGKVEIQGSTSKAEIRAEKGLKIYHNVLGGKLVIGERFVVRSELLRQLKGFNEQLTPCLIQTGELLNSPNAQNLKPGQCLKLILERKFPDLPKRAAEFEKFVLGTKDELINQELIVTARTAKRFIIGLGPLDPQAFPLLQRINQAFEQLILNISLEVPDKLSCFVEYIQGATVECGGSFECRKGAYNSNIRVDGDLNIEGVCRGGKIISGGNVQIKELGGSGVSTTTVQITGSKRLKVDYCHPNVLIIFDKEIIRIEEAYRSLEIYREKGRVQVERLRATR